jgi:YD repeat-containing protein
MNDACVTIQQRRDGAQSWRISCDGDPLLDRRIDTFETWPTSSLFMASHTDFPLAGERPFTFVRKYVTKLDQSFAFGVGANDSFDIWPVGDSRTFSWLEVELPGMESVRFDRTSPGTSYNFSKFESPTRQGSPFSGSTMEWNRGGWELTTRDDWMYRFPDCNPSKTWVQCSLVSVRRGTGALLFIKRGPKSDLRELRAPNGDVLQFDVNAKHEIVAGADASGRTVRYEYDGKGRLIHIVDPENGDAFYDYDKANRLTTVRDAQRRPLLVNAYGHYGEVTSQTLADGRRIVYEIGSTESRVVHLKITLPDGYVIEWNQTSDGFVRSWPVRP